MKHWRKENQTTTYLEFTMSPSCCNRALESMFMAILNQSHKFTVTTTTKPFSPKQVGLLE